METRKQDVPEFVEKDLDAERIVIVDNERQQVQAEPYPRTPQASNADNTAVDPLGNIHSGSAIPDPIGDTLATNDRETIEYYQADILDEDPIIGGPEGVENKRLTESPLENIADEEENILDKIIYTDPDRM